MEELMKTEWLAIINRKRNGTYPEWTSEPVVLIEDTDEKVFDIINNPNEYVEDAAFQFGRDVKIIKAK